MSSDTESVSKPTAWQNAVICQCMVLISIAILFALGGPFYETNDDVGLSMICSGSAFTNRPEPHILYSHIWIGQLLSSLYTAAPDVPWYGFYLFTAQIVAVMTITFLLSCKQSLKWALCLTSIFLLAVAGRVIVMTQFTTTSSLVGTAAGLILLSGIVHGEDLKFKSRGTAYSALLFFTASLIRIESGKLTIALTALAMIAILITKRNWKLLLKGLLVLGAMMSLVFGLEHVNRNAYNSGGWESFYPLNELRMRLFVYAGGRTASKSPQAEAAFKTVGWQWCDAEVFNGFYALDPDRFGLEKLAELDKLLPRTPESFSASTQTYLNIFRDSAVQTLLLVILLAIPLRSSSPGSLVTSCIFALLIASILAGLVFFAHCPPRVYASILLFSACFYLSTLEPIRQQRRELLRVALAAAVIGLIATSAISSQSARMKTFRQTRRANHHLKQFLRQLSDPKRLYIVWAADLPYEALLPFDNLPDCFKGVKILSVSSHGSCPLAANRMKEFNLQGDLLSQLDRADVFLISNNLMNKFITQYLVAHYSKKPVFTTIAEEQSLGVKVFRVTLEPIPGT